MAKVKKLSDEEVKSICESEMQSSTGWQSGELSKERSDAMDYYTGQPYGDEEEGQSQVVTREVLDTVEWMLPSLMRIFTDQENAVEFSPVGEEDIDAAEQETDTISHVFWQQNDGFLNLYTFIKDALLSKNGVLKIFWNDDPEEEREEYEGLNDIELSLLFQDESWDREVVKHELNEDGTHNIIVVSSRNKGKIDVIPCPPEEIGVNRDARSPDIQDCSWVHHSSKKTKAELVEAGYDRKKIQNLPSSADVNSQEDISRRHLSDEQDYGSDGDHWSMESVWITECYLRLDRNDDGVAELLKVTMAGKGSEDGSTLLDIEEVDVIPFVSFSPILLTHKYYGLSVADLVMDIQRIKSALLRGSLTNMYLANNQRTHINGQVNLDDMLVSRPGGVIRHEGNAPPAQNFAPHPHQPVPQQCFDLIGYMDEERKDRTGVSDTTAGLDASALSNVNTGVAMLAFDAQRMKIELIARICAEIGLRPAYRMMHMLLRKHQDKEMIIRLRDKFVPVDPSTWKERTDMTVLVGLGQTSRERRLMALEKTMMNQAQAMRAGLPIVQPMNMYEAAVDYTETMGIKGVNKYFTDPRMIPPEPPKPDPLMIQAQAMLIEAQSKQEGNKVDMAKIQSEEKLSLATHMQKQQEMALKGQIEEMKGQLTMLKTGTDAQSQGSKQRFEEQKLMMQTQIQGLETVLRNVQESNKRDMEQYRADLQSWTSLEQQRMSVLGQSVVQVEGKAKEVEDETNRAKGDMTALVGELQSALEQSHQMLVESRAQLEKAGAPRKRRIVRDDDGLAVAIDDMDIERDGEGNIISIG